MFLFQIQGYLFQLVATLIGCLLTFCYGILLGISFSQIKIYQLNTTPLKKTINENEANCLILYQYLGSVCGSIIFGYAAVKWGKRPVLIWNGLIQITSWFFIAFGYELIHIQTARILAGFVAGAVFTILPMYISEISENKYRGNLGSFIVFFMNIGIIFGLLLETRIHYDMIPLFGVAFSSVFTLSFPFVQESPYYYLRNGELQLMEKSIRWFRAIHSLEKRSKQEYLDEIEKFKNLHEAEKFTTTTSKCYAMKILISGFILVSGLQFCGISMFLNHSMQIVNEMGISFDENDLNLFVVGTQAIGNLICIIIADKINRKILMSVSSFGTFLSLSIAGAVIFVYKNENLNKINETFQWVLLVSFFASILLSNLGLYPLTFVILSEIFPFKVKEWFITIFMSYQWLLAFALEMHINVILNSLGIFGYIWVFAGFCLIEGILVMLLVTETRKKSFEDIQNTVQFKLEK